MFALKEKLTAALAHQKVGRLQEAERLYGEILTAMPSQPDALHLLGLLHHQKGDQVRAIELITRAIAAHPREAVFYSNRGEAYRALGGLAEAAADFRQAVALAPRSAAAHNNLGLVLKSLGHSADARVALERALALRPEFPEAFNNLGLVLQDLGDGDGAIVAFRRAVNLRTGYWEAHNNLAAALAKTGRSAEARKEFESALTTAPPERRAYFLVHIATIMAREGDNRGAADLLREATVLDPNDAVAFSNLGHSQQRLDEIDASIAACKRALALRPDFPEAHRNLGINFLLLGRYAEGWSEYAWRWRCEDFDGVRRPFQQPEWNGDTSLKGSLLVWGEQGIGDEILYASMLPDVLRSGTDFIWEADSRLVALFKRSFPEATILPRETPPHSDTTTVAAQIPAANLGRYFRDDLSKFPRKRSYLVADANASRRLRKEIPARVGELVVGISWISRNRDVGAAKTAPLAAWAPVLRTPNVCFVDLQYGDTAVERVTVTTELGVRLHHFEGLDLHNDLDDLAALISACDVVISVSNSTVHLAGALGVPIWVMVPPNVARFWYWGRGTTSTPWYPSAELIRQESDGGWGDLMQTAAARLEKACKAR